MPRYLERSEVLEIATKYHDLMLAYELAELPTADVVSKEQYDIWFEHANILAEELRKYQNTDVPERNVGTWTEMTVIHKDEAKDIIEEWQSCRCSICGHYNTQPYMYYFSEPNYCSFCGASMRKEAGNGQVEKPD